ASSGDSIPPLFINGTRFPLGRCHGRQKTSRADPLAEDPVGEAASQSIRLRPRSLQYSLSPCSGLLVQALPSRAGSLPSSATTRLQSNLLQTNPGEPWTGESAARAASFEFGATRARASVPGTQGQFSLRSQELCTSRIRFWPIELLA